MYESHFGFSRRPFLAVPDIALYCPNASMDAAKDSLNRCLARGEGIALVFGAPGTGKSYLLRTLEHSFQSDETVISITNGPLHSPKALLQQILFGLDRPIDGEELELRLRLIRHIREVPDKNIILLIDEAQLLPLEVLEEIRQLMNCDDGSSSRIRIALAGLSSFEETLAIPKADPFNQRVVVRCYLEPLNRAECVEFIRLQTAPWTVFSDAAMLSIYRHSGGVPRIINQICDYSLMLAARRGISAVEESLIQTAWAHLQQLPEPEVSPTTDAKAIDEDGPGVVDNIIEFGSLLDDDSDDVTEPAGANMFFKPDNTLPEREIVNEIIRDEFDGIEEEIEDDPDEMKEYIIPMSNEERATYVYLNRSESDDLYPKYPGYPGDGTVFFNWVGPGHHIASGTGTPYREACKKTFKESNSANNPAQSPRSPQNRNSQETLCRLEPAEVIKMTDKNTESLNKHSSFAEPRPGQAAVVRSVSVYRSRPNSLDEKFEQVTPVSRKIVPEPSAAEVKIIFGREVSAAQTVVKPLEIAEKPHEISPKKEIIREEEETRLSEEESFEELFEELAVLQEAVSQEVETIIRTKHKGNSFEINTSKEIIEEPKEAWAISALKVRVDAPLGGENSINRPHIPTGTLEWETTLKKSETPVKFTKGVSLVNSGILQKEEPKDKKKVDFLELFSQGPGVR